MRRIFIAVIEGIGLPSRQILYLDDNRINVDASIELDPLPTARSVGQLRQVLDQYDCLG
jgi:hypothetical protein